MKRGTIITLCSAALSVVTLTNAVSAQAAPKRYAAVKHGVVYCAVVTYRSPGFVKAAAGDLALRDRQPFREYVPTKGSLPGVYKPIGHVDHVDLYLLRFLNDGRLELYWEGGVKLDRVSARTFRRVCW